MAEDRESLGTRFRKTRRMVLDLSHNELKKPERLGDKNLLESEFYDRQAEGYAGNFNPLDLHVTPDDETPTSYGFMFSQLTNLAGKRVLDCCCGLGSMSVFCALQGATVIGIDISEKMLELARTTARAYKVGAKVQFVNMPVEKMDFSDGAFDLVIGSGALHHLQLEMASNEIARVLKKGGKVVFIEPLNNNRLLIWARSLIPVACLESPGGGVLRFRDIRRFGRNFIKIEITTYHLLAKIVRLSSLGRFRPVLDRIDSYLLKTFPALRWFASATVLQFYR